MSFVLVCVAADEAPNGQTGGNLLRPHHLARIEGFLDEHKIRFLADPVWLHLHKAAEIIIEDKPLPEHWAKLKEMLDPDKIDVFVVSALNRKKKLLIADMDATMVEEETLDELAARAGLREAVSGITARAMRGEIDFIGALNERVAMLKGLPITALQETLDHTSLTPGAELLLKTMRHSNAVCVLVSGGFTWFTKTVAARLQFNFHHGNALEIEDGKLTGKVIPPILDKNAKANYLEDYQTRLKLNREQTLAVGDGANDLPMLLGAGLGVGYRPKPAVREALDNNVIHTDLSSLLYIQGYRWQEIEHAVHCDNHTVSGQA